MESFLRRTVGAAALLVLMPVSQALAGSPVFDPTVDNCGDPNCSSEVVNGTTGELTGTTSTENALPWTLKVFAPGAGFCLRAEVIAQDDDLILDLGEPNGLKYFDDDSAGDLRPVIKVDPTSNRGWSTLAVSRFAGEFPGTPSGSNFTLAWGVYPSGNVNCEDPTRPLSLQAVRIAKPEADIPADNFDPESAP